MLKISYALLAILITINYTLAHEQRKTPNDKAGYVHQRIVVEAYKLLKLQLSKESSGFGDFDDYIGEARFFNQYYWYSITSVAGGAEDEDFNDIVYKNGFPFTTINHFWDADHPDGDMKIFEGGWFPSAFTKANHYINDDYIKTFIFPHDGGELLGYQEVQCAKKTPDPLWLLYWKTKLWGISGNFYLGKGPWQVEEGNIIFGNPFCRGLFYNILGRICHLLTDMGVPEHVKRSMHTQEYCAPFETWLWKNYENEFYWTAERVYKERGGFVNPFCKYQNENTRFLFYTLAQISDWFYSYGSKVRNGNDTYDDIGEIKSILDTYAPDKDYYQTNPDLNTSIIMKSRPINDEEGRSFRDVLLPYTIRVVAGLLYRFIIETKMQGPPISLEERGLVSIGTICDQQQELNLFKQEIDGDYYTFNAEGNPGRITVCPDNVTPTKDKYFIVGSLARNVTFRAAKEIVFKNGFVAEYGSSMRAYINTSCDECPPEDSHPVYNKR